MNGLRRLPFGDESVINVLRANGRSKHPEDINILEVFYNKYQTAPSLYKFEIENNDYFYWKDLLGNLSEIYPNIEEYFKEEVRSLTKDIKYLKQQTLVLREGLILQLEGSLARDLFMESHSLKESDNIITYSLFLHNGEISEEEDNRLREAFKDSVIIEKETITIGMVSYDEGTFYVKDFDIQDKITALQLLDLHYGAGFEDFDKQLNERLLNEHKGLTLFHGDPGTGKCVKGDTKIKIRNKETGLIEEININDLM